MNYIIFFSLIVVLGMEKRMSEKLFFFMMENLLKLDGERRV